MSYLAPISRRSDEKLIAGCSILIWCPVIKTWTPHSLNDEPSSPSTENEYVGTKNVLRVWDHFLDWIFRDADRESHALYGECGSEVSVVEWIEDSD